ncbi:MAG: IclR family transcriptional regulator [Clostridia bacterium]|nr:IclR family transcriptional regulator [Clostridia bacterium]
MPERPNQIVTLERALSILLAFSQERPVLSAQEIGSLTGIKRSTLYRFLDVLEQYQMLARERAGYKLGLKLLELGNIVAKNMQLRPIARPYMIELVNQTGLTANLAVYDRGEILYVENIVPKDVRVVSMYGGRGPAHCTTTGKVLLSGQSEEELERLIARGLTRYTDYTITDGAKLKCELEKIRHQGYAIDDQELEIGLRGVAAPIKNSKGEVIASLSLSGPTTRLNDETIPQLIELVVTACEAISKELGYQDRGSDS